jgi:hypothetical protein
MTNKAPAFQWYPKDCDTDEKVRGMDDREFGFYIRCLNHSWMNDGLPEDLGELARVMQRPAAYVRRVWARVGKCFAPDGQGRLRNLKQEEQRRGYQQFRESRRNAAEARWEKHKQSTSNARALHLECSASASPTANTPPPPPSRGAESSDAEDETTRTPPSVVRPAISAAKAADREILEWFERELWPIAWRKDGKGAARKSALKICRTPERRAEILAAVKAQTPKYLEREERYRPHMATWLNQERWEDGGAPTVPQSAPVSTFRSTMHPDTARRIAEMRAQGIKPGALQ